MALNFEMRTLLHKLDSLENKIKKEVVKKTLNDSADIILNEMRKTVPVDTGKLKESLEVYEFVNKGVNSVVKVGINPKRKEELEYGFWQEYGTRFYAGQHWLSGAWAVSKEKVLRKMEEILKEELTKK